MHNYRSYTEAIVDRLSSEWGAGLDACDVSTADERMRRSLFAPALGGNVPRLNLFEQWQRSGSQMPFGEWAKVRRG